MEIEAYLQELKDLQGSILSFIESEDNCDKQFLDLNKVLEDQQITNDKAKSKGLHKIILKIANNHQRTSDFFDKIGRIFDYVFKDKQSQLSNSDLTELYSSNKRIIFLLLEKGYLKPEKELINDLEYHFDRKDHQLYFYPATKSYFSDHIQLSIETHISKKYGYDINTFTEKCRIGENDSDICCMIRQDSIDDFVTYLHRTNIEFTCHIAPSLFESNPFLIQNEETCQLIDYASFFGSIQIIKYLLNNKVEPNSTIWLYAIHSNNAELIQMIEDSKIQPPDEKYESCLRESIKCHHNDISIYIEDNFMKQIDINYSAGNQLAYEIVQNYNYVFIPDIVTIISNPKKANWFSIKFICFDFKKLTIPNPVKSIGNYSFSHCNLVEVIIPDSVTSIGSYVFSGTPTLKKLTIPKSVVSFGESTFDFNMTSLEISGDLESIPNNFFSDCESLKKLTYPLSVKSIGDYAFSGCSLLNEFVIEPSIKEIGKGAFFSALSMSELVIPESVSVIRSLAFSNCISLKKVTILAPIKTIENSTFLECQNLEKIEIPSSVTKIEYGAFTGCINLDNVVIPHSVTTICDNAFYSCTKLVHIEIPSSVKSIGNNAFKKCPVYANILPKHEINNDLIPYIICYVAPSIDGKLNFHRFSNSFYSSDQDENIFDIYNKIGKDELNSNVVLIGRETFCKDFCSTFFVDKNPKPVTYFKSFVGKIDNEKDFLIVFDTKGNSIYEGEKVSKYNCIAILRENISVDYLQYLKNNNISYVFSGKDGNDLKKALSTLKKLFGFQRILLEDGGDLNGSFLKLKLINEIALLVMPFIEGMSGQPSIFECNGNKDDFPTDNLTLELLNVSAIKFGIVFTRYKVNYR